MTSEPSSACWRIWLAAGSPPMEGGESGTCRTCGEAGLGLAFGSWVRDTFTDWNKLTAGAIICHACQFCFTDRNEPLTQMLGRDKPQRMRNYSHFVRRGVWEPLSKGNKRAMLAALLDEPDVAVIATSGQKHIIFRSRVGWWQIEEASVRPFPGELCAALEVVERLYRAGISKAEIESGRYSHNRILAAGLSVWRDAEAYLKPLRGTLRFQLALFLAQREDEQDDADAGATGNAIPVAAVERTRRGVQDKVRAEHLGAVRGKREERGHDKRDAEPVLQPDLFAVAD